MVFRFADMILKEMKSFGSQKTLQWYAAIQWKRPSLYERILWFSTGLHWAFVSWLKGWMRLGHSCPNLALGFRPYRWSKQIKWRHRNTWHIRHIRNKLVHAPVEMAWAISPSRSAWLSAASPFSDSALSECHLQILKRRRLNEAQSGAWKEQNLKVHLSLHWNGQPNWWARSGFSTCIHAGRESQKIELPTYKLPLFQYWSPWPKALNVFRCRARCPVIYKLQPALGPWWTRVAMSRKDVKRWAEWRLKESRSRPIQLTTLWKESAGTRQQQVSPDLPSLAIQPYNILQLYYTYTQMVPSPGKQNVNCGRRRASCPVIYKLPPAFVHNLTGTSSGILPDISSDILFGILSGISSGNLLAFYLANLLAFYLAYLLAFYLTYLLAFYLAFYLTYLLAFYLAFYLAYLLAYILTYLLAFYLAFYLAYLLEYLLAYLSGISSGIFSGILPGKSSGTLSDILSSYMFPAGPQPRPSTPSVPCRTSTASIHAQLRSGREHWAWMVVVEVRQGTLGVDTRGWGPAGNTVDRGSQLDEDDEDDEDDKEDEEDEEDEEARRRTRRRTRRTRQEEEEATDIKSNNPHLAGGEKLSNYMGMGQN